VEGDYVLAGLKRDTGRMDGWTEIVVGYAPFVLHQAGRIPIEVQPALIVIGLAQIGGTFRPPETVEWAPWHVLLLVESAHMAEPFSTQRLGQ
jgi:hypothetical protein